MQLENANVAAEPLRATRREWIGLAVIALPGLLYAMDLTVLDLAVPHLSADLEPTAPQLLWIIDIYGFLVAGSLITMGTLGDRIGRRRLLMIGAATFGAASVLAAFSSSAEMLIGARALLGLAGATLAPSTLSLIRSMFLDPDQRRVAIGIWITSYSVGGAIGPVLGGVLLQFFWWGSVFLLGVPVMVLLLAVGPRLLPEYRDPNAGRLDLLSAGLSLAAVLLSIYGLKQIAVNGLEWVAALTIAAGVILGLVFVRRQRALPNPLIDLRFFRSAEFNVSLATYALGTFVGFGIYVLIAQYLQMVLGLSPLKAGLATVPQMASFIVGSAIVPPIARRVRPAYTMAGGLTISAIGFGLLTLVDQTGLVGLVIGSVVYSIGLSPVVILATDLIVGSARVEHAGAASAISETSSELGGALGIAILGSVGTAVYRSVIAQLAPQGISHEALETARNTIGGALEVARQLSGPQGDQLLGASREAFTQAFELTALVCAGLTLTAAIATALLLRNAAASPAVAEAAA